MFLKSVSANADFEKEQNTKVMMQKLFNNRKDLPGINLKISVLTLWVNSNYGEQLRVFCECVTKIIGQIN